MDLFGNEFVLKRDGCPIHYRVCGPDGAPWVILFHGGQMDHRMFAPQMEMLCTGQRVLAFDARGHGDSQPLRGALSYRSLAEDGLALLDEVGADRAVFIGHSMGGCAVQETLRCAPQRVKAAALIGSFFIGAAAPVSMHIVSLVLTFLVTVLPEARLQRLMEGAANMYSLDTGVREYIRACTRRLSRVTFRQTFRLVREGYRPGNAFRSPAPLLLACGDSDAPQIRNAVAAWAAQEPAARLALIPHAGHNANQDNPGEFNRILAAFLAGFH